MKRRLATWGRTPAPTHGSPQTPPDAWAPPLAGGTVTTLGSGLGEPSGIAVDAHSVYWTDYLDGTVMKVTPK